MKYKKVSREEARKIITNRVPLGKFYEVDKERFVGIDNSTGDAWVEEFTTKQECIDWLEGKGKEDEEISITKISKGDIVKTAWCPKTLVLKVEEDKALLFNGNQFVVAHGIQKEGDNVFWGQGHYYDDIPEDPFNKLKYKDSEVKKMLDKIMAINFKGFIKALISIEKEIEDERILNQVYDRFMDRYYISLINDYFDEIIQELAEENTIEDDWDLEL